MRRLLVAGATDVGRVRQGNEDALLVTDGVFAVADGMGGHLAGEVASEAALEPIRTLQGRVFADASAASTALRDAVVAANETVSELAEREPAYRGMGTTLTAALVEGRRLHLAHVGDSRAYLLRDGHFSQLTDDHTLVQHLIDEGQLTREEAARHPQRSIITRAIGVSRELEVDSMSLELEPDDQLLLCSDGLTGVVPDVTIAQTLDKLEDPDATVRRLIALANESGGPDNITVLLLRYEDPSSAAARPNRTISIQTRDEEPDADWADRLGNYGLLGRPGPDAPTDDEPRQAGQILGRAVAIVLALVVVAAIVGGAARFLLAQSYFVGLDDEQLVVYQGIDVTLGPLQLSRVVERSELSVDDVPSWYRDSLESGVTAADLNDARRIIDNAPRRSDEQDGDDDADGLTDGDPLDADSTADGDPLDADSTADGDPLDADGTAGGDPLDADGTASAAQPSAGGTGAR
jgi:PPM family protein phosphatase